MLIVSFPCVLIDFFCEFYFTTKMRARTLRLIVERCVRSPPRGDDLASVLYAMAFMRVADGRVQSKLVPLIGLSVADMGCQAVSRAVLALGTYEAPTPPNVIGLLCTRAMSLIDGFNLTQTSHIVEGLTRLKVQSAAKVVEALEGHVLRLADWAQEDAMTAAGALHWFARWGVSKESVLHVLLRKMEGRTEEVGTAVLTGSLTSAMRLKVTHPGVMREAMSDILGRAEPLTAGQVGKLWSMVHTVPSCGRGADSLPVLLGRTLLVAVTSSRA